MYIDGTPNAQGVGIGTVLVSLESVRVKHSLRLCFWVSNNENEYEVLIVGLRAAKKMEAEEVKIFSDSRLVVNQVEGSFKARDP